MNQPQTQTISASPRSQNLKWFVLAIVLGTAVAYFSRQSAYIALFGVIAFGISLLRFGSDQRMAQLRKVAMVVAASGLLAIVGGLFANPWQGSVEKEDRTDWKPAPKIESTPNELLALEWSSTNENADWPVSRLMLELCKIAYKDPVDANKELAEMGFQSESISSGSMNGYVASIGDHAVILLRGTESNVYDIVQDLRFLKSTNDKGSMHGGFVNGYQGMHGQVQKLLEQYDAKKVWITGHSLGGALAVVCANNIIEDAKYEIAGVMTFGQPKVVREDMRSFLEPKLAGKYVFFVNDMDPVTRVVDPYVHFGHMVRYADGEIERSLPKPVLYGGKLGAQNASPEYTDDLNDQELEGLIERLEGTAEPVFTKDGRPVVQGYIPRVSDHKLDSYSTMLDALIGDRR